MAKLPIEQADSGYKDHGKHEDDKRSYARNEANGNKGATSVG